MRGTPDNAVPCYPRCYPGFRHSGQLASMSLMVIGRPPSAPSRCRRGSRRRPCSSSRRRDDGRPGRSVGARPRRTGRPGGDRRRHLSGDSGVRSGTHVGSAEAGLGDPHLERLRVEVDAYTKSNAYEFRADPNACRRSRSTSAATRPNDRRPTPTGRSLATPRVPVTLLVTSCVSSQSPRSRFSARRYSRRAAATPTKTMDAADGAKRLTVDDAYCHLGRVVYAVLDDAPPYLPNL